MIVRQQKKQNLNSEKREQSEKIRSDSELHAIDYTL